MQTPEERTRLLASCDELAKCGEWLQVGEICERIITAEAVPALERADWMRRQAIWVWQEGLTTGRSINPARSLLADALPLAKNDHYLQGQLLVEQTRMLMGADVERAARQFWTVLGKCPTLEKYRGTVLYNLGYSNSVCGHLDTAARYYRKAALVLKGRYQGWAYLNLAEVCAHLGQLRAAETAAHKAKPLLSAEDMHMHVAILAYLSVLRGYSARAHALIEEGLNTPGCPPVAQAHLWYYKTLCCVQSGDFDQAGSLLDKTWRFAVAHNLLWVCDRLTRLQAELDSRKGVS